MRYTRLPGPRRMSVTPGQPGSVAVAVYAQAGTAAVLGALTTAQGETCDVFGYRGPKWDVLGLGLEEALGLGDYVLIVSNDPELTELLTRPIQVEQPGTIRIDMTVPVPHIKLFKLWGLVRKKVIDGRTIYVEQVDVPAGGKPEHWNLLTMLTRFREWKFLEHEPKRTKELWEQV